MARPTKEAPRPLTAVFIVTDEWMAAESPEDGSRLVGVFDSEEKAQAAVDAVDAHWETLGEEEEHFCAFFEFSDPMNAITMPDYEPEEDEEDEEEGEEKEAEEDD
jgi:hypothetical protein